VHHRVLEFVAWRNPDRESIQFLAIDKEWLPGRVATDRWVNHYSPEGESLFQVAPGPKPATLVFKPPGPFFGVGIYRRSNHLLNGTLGVHFLGLKLHLTPRPLYARFEDERPGPSDSNSQATPAGTALGEADSVSVFLELTKDGQRHPLELSVFPLEGVVAVRTDESPQHEDNRGVNYVMAIPKGPFDGSLDLELPGLGVIDGTVAPDHPLGPAGQKKLCEGREYPAEYGHFRGQFEFRGAGGYASWKAREAEASIVLTCGALPSRGNGVASLYDHLDEGADTDFSGDFVTLIARGETPARTLTFIAVGDQSEGRGTLIGIDTEWLPGEVLAQRSVKYLTRDFGKAVRFPLHEDFPSKVVLTPPAPFFGRAVYRPSTGKVAGTLGAHFLGLSTRLARPPLGEVAFNDEEPPLEGPPKHPHPRPQRPHR
jgi:hypothetical protein